MKYEEFKEHILSRIAERIAENSMEGEVELHKVYKVNRQLDCFSIRKNTKMGSVIVPAFYLEELYEKYVKGADLERILSDIMTALQMTPPHQAEAFDILAFDKIRRRIIPQLIHHGKNEALLQRAVHKDFLDLAVIYRIEIGEDEEKIASVIVNEQMRKAWRIGRDELHEIAFRNMERDFPTVLKNPFAILNLLEKEAEDNFYVLTNQRMRYGAAEMMHASVLKKVAEVIGGSFYILPSSTHELFLCKADQDDERSRNCMKRTIADANRTVVPAEDYLSDSLYFYDAEEEMAIIA